MHPGLEIQGTTSSNLTALSKHLKTPNLVSNRMEIVVDGETETVLLSFNSHYSLLHGVPDLGCQHCGSLIFRSTWPETVSHSVF